VNRAGNVLAIMPHPERDAWTYQHIDGSRDAARGDTAATLAPSGGIRFFEHFRARSSRAGYGVTRTFAVSLIIPDNEAFTAYETLARLGVPAARVVRKRYLAVRGRARGSRDASILGRPDRDPLQSEQAPLG